MPTKRFIVRLPFFFGAAILILLIAKLPGVTALFTPFDCTRCTIGSPIITWIGGGYFSGLLAFMYLAPQFFSRPIASIGMVYAIVIGTLLLWLSPTFCYICFFAHLLHVSMWGYFLVFPQHGIVLIAPFLRQLLCAVQIGLLGTLAYYGLDEGLFKLEHAVIPLRALTTLEGETLNSNALNPYRYICTFPTLIVLDSKAHVVQVVVGTYSRLEEELAQAISE